MVHHGLSLDPQQLVGEADHGLWTAWVTALTLLTLMAKLARVLLDQFDSI